MFSFLLLLLLITFGLWWLYNSKSTYKQRAIIAQKVSAKASEYARFTMNEYNNSIK